MIFPLADQISVQEMLSTNSSQTLSKLLISSAKCGLKGANVQKNRVAKVNSRSDWLSKRGCLALVADASRKQKF